ncbi:MAG: anti-sigma factor family protein [Planctomycetota bacterium]
MNCASALRELPLLGTGELEPRTEAALWRHLEACPACRVHREEDRALDEVLSAWRTGGACRDIAPEVLAAAGDVAPGAAHPGFLRRSLGPLLAAAAVLASLSLLPFLETGRPAPDREEPDFAIARADLDPVPIGTGLSGLALPARNPFRP